MPIHDHHRSIRSTIFYEDDQDRAMDAEQTAEMKREYDEWIATLSPKRQVQEAERLNDLMVRCDQFMRSRLGLPTLEEDMAELGELA